MEPELLLKASALVGSTLLQNGAETIRVEQTVMHFCKAYYVEDVNVFATPTGLFLSFEYKQITYSKTCRIPYTTINLSKINLVNDLSRQCSQKDIPIKEALQRLLEIESHTGYSNLTKQIASGLVATFFTFFFGHNLAEGIFAFFIGFLVQITSTKLSEKKINPVVRIMFLSAMISFFALLLLQFQLIQNKDGLIIGCLMLLVPGVAITNAIRDTISGDLLSGITRAIEAFLIAISLAIGAGVMITIWTTYIGGVI